jgi:hypothetical protein
MEKERSLSEQLREMAQIDIRTADPSELVEIENVKISPELSQEDRVLDYIRQIRNPYCYLYHGIVVKVSFAGKRKMEDCLKDCLFTNI